MRVVFPIPDPDKLLRVLRREAWLVLALEHECGMLYSLTGT